MEPVSLEDEIRKALISQRSDELLQMYLSQDYSRMDFSREVSLSSLSNIFLLTKKALEALEIEPPFSTNGVYYELPLEERVKREASLEFQHKEYLEAMIQSGYKQIAQHLSEPIKMFIVSRVHVPIWQYICHQNQMIAGITRQVKPGKNDHQTLTELRAIVARDLYSEEYDYWKAENLATYAAGEYASAIEGICLDLTTEVREVCDFIDRYTGKKAKEKYTP